MGSNQTKDKKATNVHSGHRERLREQFFFHGESMREHQILELMLSYVIPQKDTNPIAHELINKFGSISQVVDSPIEELMQVKGVSKVVASFLNFQSKFIGIYKKSKANNKPYLKNINDIIEYLKQVIEIGEVERFYYLCLDTKDKLISFREMGVGTDKSVNLSSKEFINNIINYKAHSVALCHTHPCGIATPSIQDKMLTQTIYSLLEGINVKLIDHIILSHDGCYSFFQNKILDKNIYSAQNVEKSFANKSTLFPYEILEQQNNNDLSDLSSMMDEYEFEKDFNEFSKFLNNYDPD